MICILKDGEKIREMIARKGMSLRGFSQTIEISHSYLSQILNGKRNPSPPIARKIATGLGKDIKDLFVIENRDEVMLVD